MSDEKDVNIKMNIPLFTNLELEDLDYKLDNYLDNVVQEISEAVLRDKENILLQKVIQKLQRENKELNILLKQQSKDIGYMVLNYIPKDKIRAKIEELQCDDDNYENYAIRRAYKELLEE